MINEHPADCMCFGCKLSTLAAESLKDNPDPPRKRRGWSYRLFPVAARPSIEVAA